MCSFGVAEFSDQVKWSLLVRLYRFGDFGRVLT